jgi:hypothetical protein
MKNIFQADIKHRQHLSVGAIIFNDKKEICFHKFKKEDVAPRLLIDNLDRDLYLCMSESLEMGETLEEAVHRGLQEEFGITADIIGYAGSVVAKYQGPETGKIMEKTTIYFVCNLISQDESLREDGIEGSTEVFWKPIDFLIEKSHNQGTGTNFETFDESAILERVKKDYL